MNQVNVDALCVPIETELSALRKQVATQETVLSAINAKILVADSSVQSLRASLGAIPIDPDAPVPIPVPVTAKFPELDASCIKYSRNWRLPTTSAVGNFNFGGGPITDDPVAGTFFVGNRDDQVAEVRPPDTGSGFGTIVQDFLEISEGSIIKNWSYIDGTGNLAKLAGLTGLLLIGDGKMLMGTALVYYDALGAQRVSHFTRPRDFKSRGAVSPFTNVGMPEMAGFMAGYMNRIPLEWQVLLKGTHVTGTFGSPIVSRGSLGPALFSFVPAPTSMSATSLVYYPGDHPTLGTYGSTLPNVMYGMTAKADGVVIIDGTCTTLFVGRNGLGAPKYGAGTGNKALDGTIESGSDPWVFDPANSNKGPHAYPYQYQIWAYNTYDLADAAAGRIKPWDVIPYAIWPLALPTPEPSFAGIGGATYRATSKNGGILTISQKEADSAGVDYQAIMHEFAVSF